MPKRCAEEQLELAWSTRETRPDPKKFKGDDEGWKQAQMAWVESRDGHALPDEARRAAWWKEVKKQHGKLCAKYEELMEKLGEPVAAAASTASTTAAASSANELASSADALASSADAPASSADAASQAATARAAIRSPPGAPKAALSLSVAAALPSATASPSATAGASEAPRPSYNLRRPLATGQGWVQSNAPSVVSLIAPPLVPTPGGSHAVRTLRAELPTPSGQGMMSKNDPPAQ